MAKGPTYNDVINESATELKKFYRLSERQLEQNVRKHLYGAGQREMTKMYEKIYDNKGKR
jgi:hypothetical protein